MSQDEREKKLEKVKLEIEKVGTDVDISYRDQYMLEKVKCGMMPVCYVPGTNIAYYPAAQQNGEDIAKWIDAKTKEQLDILEQFKKYYGVSDGT